MSEVSWTSNTRVGGVSGLGDLFRTTFVFGINSLDTLTVPDKSSDKRSGGGGSMFGMLQGVVDQWIPYSHLLHFSDKF